MKLWDASPSRSSRGNASSAAVHVIAAWFSGLLSARLHSAPAAPAPLTASWNESLCIAHVTSTHIISLKI